MILYLYCGGNPDTEGQKSVEESLISNEQSEEEENGTVSWLYNYKAGMMNALPQHRQHRGAYATSLVCRPHIAGSALHS